MKLPGARLQHGFTLIEVIIAFALLSLALTLLLGSMSGAAKQIRNADDAGRATLHAQSLLAQIGSGEVLKPATRQGDFEGGRYHWVLEITPYLDPMKRVATVAAHSAPSLLRVKLVVSWGGAPDQQLQWKTLRLVPADYNAPVMP